MENERINFDYLCRKCWKLRKENEDFFGFNVEDDYGNVMEIRGHKECVDELRSVIKDAMNLEDE